MTATNWSYVFLGMMAHVVNDGSVYIFAALIPHFRESGMSYVEAGLAWTVLNLVGSLPQPFLGLVADRLKGYRLAGIGVLVTVLFLGPVGFVPVANYSIVLLLAVIAGIGTMIMHPVAASFTAASGGPRQGLAMSLFSLGGNVGFAIAPLLLPPLIVAFGPQASAALVPVGLLVGIPLLRASDKVRQMKVPQPQRVAGVEVPKAPVLSLALLVLVALLRMWVYTGTITFLPTYLTARGLSPIFSAQLLSIMLVMGAIGSLIGGGLYGRFSPKWATIGSHAMATIFFAMFFATSGTVSIVALALAGFCLLWSMAVTIVMAQKLLPNSQSLASGLMIGLGIGLGGIGVSVTGWMADLFGIVVAVPFLTVVTLLTTVMLLPYREKRAESTLEARPSPAGV